MNTSVFIWEIIGALFIIAFGSLMHFCYAWSGYATVVGLFAPVNESVWEHLKMAFWPLVLYSAVEFVFVHDLTANFIFAEIHRFHRFQRHHPSRLLRLFADRRSPDPRRRHRLLRPGNARLPGAHPPYLLRDETEPARRDRGRSRPGGPRVLLHVLLLRAAETGPLPRPETPDVRPGEAENREMNI